MCVWSVYSSNLNKLCVFLFCLGAQPPLPDHAVIKPTAEFSHVHCIRDDDLISLKIEPHRY